jgi:hypothetical protein
MSRVTRSCHGRVRLAFCPSSSTNSASANIRYTRLRLPLASVPPPSEPPSVAFLRPIMSSIASQDTSSSISQPSHGGANEEDWDRSESDIQPESDSRTPRNSVLFPADGGPDLSPRKGGRRGDRTLSELLKLYAEKGTDCQFSQEEATRIADVLGQWVRPLLLRLPLLPLKERLKPHLLLLDKFGLLPLRGRG